ncbi:MAG: hypothetical protein ACAI38_23605 [Myxococcota bacterium]
MIGDRMSAIGSTRLSVVAFLLLLASPARAELVPTYSSTTGARINPLGLFEQFQLRLTKPLASADETDPLWAGTYVRAEATLFASPATIGPGVGITAQPINILRLSASYTPIYYWGTFDSLQSFQSPNADYRPSQAENRPSYSAWIHQWNIALLLQMKVKRFVVRSETVGSYLHANLQGSDTVYYDFVWDIATPKRGWVIQNDSDFLWLVTDRLTVGVRNTLITAIYPDWVFLPGEDRDPDNLPTDRMGPIIAYKLSLEKTGKFREPTLFLTTQWYIASKYRTGEDVSRAIPYLLGGINFSGW